MPGARCRGLDISFTTAVKARLRRLRVGVGDLPLSIESRLSEVRQRPHRPKAADRGPKNGAALPKGIRAADA